MSHHEPECEPASIDCDNRGYQRSNDQNLWMSLGSVFMLRSLNIRCEVLCQPTGSRRMTGNFLEVFFWYS